MGSPAAEARLARIEEKLDRILALLGQPATPRPGPAAGSGPDLVSGPDELHVWRCTFSALHGVERFPELVREWFRTHAGPYTHKALIAELARGNPKIRTIFPTRLGAFMRAHEAWLGVVREKDKGVTVWRSSRR